MIDIQLLIAKVKEKVAQNPDVRYDPNNEEGTCLYTKGKCSDGSIGCVFGQVGKEMGIDMSRFEHFDGIEWSCESIKNILIHDYEYERDSPEVVWCSLVQKFQDRSKTWGEAVKLADSTFSVLEV